MAPAGWRPLRLLSYNIQTGIAISRYRHYVTQSWKHVLPYRKRMANLNRIARIISEHDIVGLQEADAGSIRSEFINQVDYLADRAGFPFRCHQTNRRLGKIAQHSLGLLSRISPQEVIEHRLPGPIPGRGALIARIGEGARPLTLIILHLALGRRARLRQLDYLGEIIRGCPHAIVMGDFNSRSESREMDILIGQTGLSKPTHGLHTFPSWRPQKNIDHILVSPSLRVLGTRVLRYPFSDHLPLSATVMIPEEVGLAAYEPIPERALSSAAW